MKNEGKKVCIWSIVAFISFFLSLIIYLITISRLSMLIKYDIDAISIMGYSILGSIFLPITFGIIALIKISRNKELKGWWLAILSLLLGIFTLILLILFLSLYGQQF